VYAVIRTGGKQYRVSEGDIVRIEKLDAEEGSSVQFNDVLLVKTDSKTYIGQPLVPGASVTGVLEAQVKGDKVIVFKYKRRKQYRRKRGHRQLHSEVRIEKISVSD